jgi:phosphonate transport system ATP-binding protein
LRIEAAFPEQIGRMEPAIDVAHLTKTFGGRRGRAGHKALDDTSLKIMPGEMVALIGASGSGKSTLLRHVAGLVASDPDPRCSVAVHGGSLQSAGRAASDIRQRRRDISVVFQQFNLVDRLPVLTNVLVGMLGRVPLWRSLPGIFTAAEKQLALQAMTRVGIAELVGQRASTLSGGQQQRAAIARALVQRARIILADEPIASLDPESSRRVMELLARINREDGTTIVVSLHQVDYALGYCRRVVALRRGRVVYDGPSATVTKELLRELYGSELDQFESDAPEPERADPRRQGGRGRLPLAATVEATL